MRLYFALPLIFIFFPGCAEKSSVNTPFVTLKIYHTNDIHSHLVPNNLKQGGLAYLASVLKFVRQQEPDSLILDAGDMYRKGHLPARETHDEVMANLVHQMPYYDARVVGNNEIKLSVKKLIEWSKSEERAPLLSANLVDRQGLPVFDPFIIFSKSGLKVGVIGITFDETFDESEVADPHETYKVLNSESTLKPLVAKLRPQVDVLILLSHENYKKNLHFAKIFPEIDLVICGHSHLLTPERKSLKQALVVEAGEFAQQLGAITLVYDRSKKKVVSEESSFWPIGPDYQVPDPKISKTLEEAYKKYAPKALEKIGTAAVSLVQLRAGSPFEGSLDDWIADIFQEKTKADVAIINRAMLRENLVKGPITVEDLYLSAPYQDEIAVIDVKRPVLEKMVKEQISLEFDSTDILPFAFSRGKLSLLIDPDTNHIKKMNLDFASSKPILQVALPMYVVNHCGKFFPKKFCPLPHAMSSGSVISALIDEVRRKSVIEFSSENRVAVKYSKEIYKAQDD